MDSDSRNLRSFSYGAPPPRIDRLEQIVIPQHSTLAQPRMVPEGANPLDLTSAIVHELQRSINHHQLGWQSWTPQLGGGGAAEHLQLPGYGSYQLNNGAARLLPQNIRHFDDTTALAPPEFSSESLASAPQPGFYSRSQPPLHLNHQVFEGSRSACSPWIERMMQADVTPTPAPSLGISTSLSLAQTRGVTGDVSCVASQTVDFGASCHSSDLQQPPPPPQQQQQQQQQQNSIVAEYPQRESTVEGSADLCTDEEDQDHTRPIDEKRKKRMLSNRASAQRSRQRRQERLDQLEVLTAKLRVENSTLQKKLSAAIQVAKKYEDQNKTLQKKVEKLTEEVEGDKSKKAVAAIDECANSQQTTCASSCEMVGGRTSTDLNGTNEASTQSMSAGSPTEKVEVSPVRRSFSACRVGKKRSFTESEEGGGQPNRSQANSSFVEPRSAFGTSFALDPALKDDGTMDCLEADRWLEFVDFGLGFK